MDKNLWEAYDLSELDRQLISIELQGNVPTNCKLVVATNPETGSIISGLTHGLAPVGYFNVVISSIINTVEYANGHDPELSPLQTQKVNIYLLNECLLFSIETRENVAHQFVDKIYAQLKPKEIAVMASTHSSLFANKEIPVPSLFTFAKDSNEGKLGGLILDGVAAGLMTLSDVHNIKCQVFYVVEDDYGESSDSIKLHLEKLLPILNLDSGILGKILSLTLSDLSIKKTPTSTLYT